MHKNQSKLAILSIFLAAALVGSVVAFGDNYAHAGGKKKSNDSEQGIGQSSSTGQSSSCFSENGTSLASCNNVEASFNLNFGENAAGQQ